MAKEVFERPIIKKISVGISNKFGLKSEFEPLTHIEDVPVKDIVREYGSPVFVISELTIRKMYKEAKRAFETRYPKVQFAWSYKTNYLNSVCRIFHQEGAWAEVVSMFEFEKALNLGVDGSHIIYNGPEKTDENLRYAVEKGALIHIDHFDELYSLLDIAASMKKTPKVAIRVNMDTGVYPMWDRFGFNYENGEAWEAINRIMLSKKLHLVGLHTHIGTFMLSTNAYAVATAKLVDLAINIEKKYNHYLDYIDLGGGFASKNTLKGSYLLGVDVAPTFDDYAEAITTTIINSQISPEHLPLLILETGRALIDDAGYLIGTVLANKRLSDGRKAIIVDVGVNLLFTSFWYDHKIIPAQEFSPHTELTSVYGPLCMNIDQLRENVALPPVKRGDIFVISRVGAYNLTQWMQFITMRPNVVLIDMKGQTHLIRKRETTESINQFEVIPDYLNEKK